MMPEVSKDNSLKELYFNGRCYNAMAITTIQDPQALSPALRNCVDYVFIFNI